MEDNKRKPLWLELLEEYKRNLGNGNGEEFAMRSACITTGVSKSQSSADEIMRLLCYVANYHGISVQSIKRQNRARSAVLARSQAAWIARKLGHTLEEIGANIGNRHHTTIMACIDRVKANEQWVFVCNELLKTFQGKDKCE